MIFIDFEVTKYDWLCVIIDPFEKKYINVVNDPAKLELIYQHYKKDIWVGYNIRGYDQYILKSILFGYDPKEVNDFIILDHMKGWEYSKEFNRISLHYYDAMTKVISLKTLESFMGNDIRESQVSFDIDRKLTEEEINELLMYCTHDVEQLIEVFLQNKSEFDSQIAVLNTFDLPINHIGKTQTQLAAVALGCVKKKYDDEWMYEIIDTLRISKYQNVVNWFKNNRFVQSYDDSLHIDVCGVPHIFGWGGLHGAPDHPLHEKGCLIHVDVTSFYPSIMIEYDMLSRNVSDKSVYKKIYDQRVELKKAGKKKEQAPYKLILNKTYGGSKDVFSALYDPRKANEVCINGQLLLLDLLEHLEGYCKIIQSNTDGLIIKIEDTDEAFEKIDDICYEWETRTHMSLGFDFIKEIYQKDVNNYLWIDEDDQVTRIGAYVKPLNDLDNDLPIINKALVERMVNKTPIEETINNCNELKMFQKTVKVSDLYLCGMHNGWKLIDKTFRVFASKRKNDSAIYKVKDKDGVEVPEKFANTPEHCFIENGDINGVKVPDHLDKDWYIQFAKNRLDQFGIKDQYELS